MILVFGEDQLVAEWVARRIPHVHREFRDFAAIGVWDGEKLAAGVVYNDHQAKYGTLQISMAADSPRWAQRGVIRALLHYPFEQVGVNKVWTATPHENERAIRFNLGIGFTREATLRHHFGRKKHCVVCSMLSNEYRRRYG